MKDTPNNLNPRKQNCTVGKLSPLKTIWYMLNRSLGVERKKTSREGGEYFVES
jgi:hypothetical protein